MKMDVETKRQREKKMVSLMIAIYCRGRHGTQKGTLCPACDELNTYARLRSDRCPFMEVKTFCANCKVHCYKPAMREQIRDVMRYAGPRMMLHNTVAAIRHLIETKREEKIGRLIFFAVASLQSLDVPKVRLRSCALLQRKISSQ